jgi:hypothetical protein
MLHPMAAGKLIPADCRDPATPNLADIYGVHVVENFAVDPDREGKHLF